PFQVLFYDLVLDRIDDVGHLIVKKDAVADVVFQIGLFIEPAQQVLADEIEVCDVFHGQRASNDLIGPLINTGRHTNTQVLADSAHSDPQRIYSSESISQSSPGLDLFVSLPLMIAGYDIAIAGHQLIHAVFQTFQLLLMNLRIWIDWQSHVLLQGRRRRRLAFSQILPPDIFCYSVTISQGAWTLPTGVYFSDYNVNRFVEQVIRICAAFMYEVPNQLHSDRLILSHSQFIILRKPTKKLPKGLRCESPFGLPWHHRRPTIKRQRPEVDSFT